MPLIVCVLCDRRFHYANTIGDSAVVNCTVCGGACLEVAEDNAASSPAPPHGEEAGAASSLAPPQGEEAGAASSLAPPQGAPPQGEEAGTPFYLGYPCTPRSYARYEERCMEALGRTVYVRLRWPSGNAIDGG